MTGALIHDFLPAVRFARITDATRRHVCFIATTEEHFDRLVASYQREDDLTVEVFKFTDASIVHATRQWLAEEEQKGDGRPSMVMVGSIENGQWVNWNLKTVEHPPVPDDNVHYEHVRGKSMPNGISITNQLEPHEWSNEETAAYEAAIEAVNGAVGAYSAVISAEEAKAAPDRSVIEDARAAQTQLAREREGLRSSDREQIAAARSRYAQLTREVLAGIG
ncbi:hypothetical protein GCM10010293_68590 [Streptomyces griseoflavus]|uniref:hypothetical protein n=1 Tax=Streptomyces griseoflavus TaxID=35619 RepID=UPI00199B8EB8|nr:hypothetical protein [Streptomyces griseoflavus]GGV54583.1 hypothetical protein GCM10010293_68590 [Streptomyces griseoflavus]